MKRNLLFIACFLAAIGVFCWFSFSGGKQLYHYLKLNHEASVVIDKWAIEEKGSDRYAVIAFFSFDFGEAQFKGKAQIGGTYLNPWAAEMAEKQFNKQKWTVWFDPKQPSRAVLDKKFPVKAVVSSSVAILCGIYVLVLIWTGVKNGNSSIIKGSHRSRS